MNAILVGYQGMQDMLVSIHGKAEAKGEQAEPVFGTRGRAPPPKPKVEAVNSENWNQVPTDKMPKLTASDFDRMFGGSKGKPN